MAFHLVLNPGRPIHLKITLKQNCSVTDAAAAATAAAEYN